ncbi:hypothetical protein MTO96_026030 [Rhipicephalus appendiculatus]
MRSTRDQTSGATRERGPPDRGDVRSSRRGFHGLCYQCGEPGNIARECGRTPGREQTCGSGNARRRRWIAGWERGTAGTARRGDSLLTANPPHPPSSSSQPHLSQASPLTPYWSSPRYITPPPARYPMALTTGPLHTTGPLRKRGPATNCQPSRESQSAAPEPQPPWRGHLDVPGLRGNPPWPLLAGGHGAARRKGKPPARQTGGPLDQGGSADHAGVGRPKHYTDWLISVATNHLSGGFQQGAVQTTGLPAPDPRRQQRRCRRQRRRQLGKL